MAISGKQLVALYRQRQNESSPTLELMREIRSVSNGEIAVPLPEMDKSEKPAVANLIAEGIDQISARVASTMPHLICPAVNPRLTKGPRSTDYADIRRKAILGWWDESRIRRVNRRRARFLVAYGVAPVHIKPDFRLGFPRWHVRDPLQTYPNPSQTFDDDQPEDVIFAFRKPLAWIERHYPEQAGRLFKGHVQNQWEINRSKLFTVLEYVDAEEMVLAVMGEPRSEHDYSGVYEYFSEVEVLERVQNKAGVCTVITPKRITLDRVFGQFNQVVGIYQAQAKLFALDLIASEKAVFPDMVLIGENGQAPQLLGDEWKDGRTGEFNELMNGNVSLVQLNPGFHTGEAMDRLERAMRIHGVAPQFGGENPTNIRTGRAAEITMSAQVDFRVQEYQETMADSMVLENKRAIAVAKGWFGEQKKSFYVQWKGASGPVDYLPRQHFETDMNRVIYPMPGADVNALMMSLGQRLGAGMISHDTARELDPLIEDAELEGDRVVSNELDRALMASIAQLAAQGQIPPFVLSRLKKKIVQEDMDIADAIEAVQKEMQEEQAQPTEPGSPEAQPGMGPPGEAAPSVPGVDPDVARMRQLLFDLRQPESAAGGRAPEMAAGAGA